MIGLFWDCLIYQIDKFPYQQRLIRENNRLFCQGVYGLDIIVARYSMRCGKPESHTGVMVNTLPFPRPALTTFMQTFLGFNKDKRKFARQSHITGVRRAYMQFTDQQYTERAVV